MTMSGSWGSAGVNAAVSPSAMNWLALARNVKLLTAADARSADTTATVAGTRGSLAAGPFLNFAIQARMRAIIACFAGEPLLGLRNLFQRATQRAWDRWIRSGERFRPSSPTVC